MVERSSPAAEATPPMTRIADEIARTLHDSGARRAWGVVGGEVLTLVDALSAAGVPYRSARHENAAGFAAEGGHHATGELPVLVATIGPGVANAINVAANALQDHVPLVILGGAAEATAPAQFTHQVIDQVKLFEAVTKASVRIAGPDALDRARRAMRLATTPPLGPVYLDVPSDVADQLANAGDRERPTTRPSGADASLPAGWLETVRQAQRPLAIVGLQAMPEARRVAAWLRREGLPTIQTYKAKGLLDEHDPLALAAAGLSPRADEVLLPLCAEADLVLLLGFDPVEMRANWNTPFGTDTRVLAWTPAAMPGLADHADEILEAPLDTRLEALETARATWPDGRPSAAREELERRFQQRSESAAHRALLALQRVLDRHEDLLFCVDTGAHRILAAQTLRMRASRRMLQSTGFCTMACALPLAIGARRAAPERPVVALLGDGGLEMGLGELATLRDLGGPLPIIVFDDSSYALIGLKQRARGLIEQGCDLAPTAFEEVARAFGGTAVTVSDADTLGQEVEKALGASHFTLLRVPLERGSYDGLL